MIRTEIKCEELQKKMAAMQEETATQINAVTEAMGQFTDISNGDREETMAIINQEKVAINESLAKINALAGELHLTWNNKIKLYTQFDKQTTSIN